MCNQKSCPLQGKCLIFQPGILFSENTAENYKKVYCRTARYKECKRFMASQLVSRPVSVSVMPNSKMSMKEILAQPVTGGG